LGHGLVKEYAIDSGLKVRSFEHHKQSQAYSTGFTLALRSGANFIATNEATNTILSGTSFGSLQQWDIRNGGMKRTLVDGNSALTISPINAVGISPNGQFGVWSETYNLHIIDLKSMSDSKSLQGKGHANMATDITFTPDSKFFVTALRGETLRLWDLQKSKELHTFRGHTDYVNSVAIGSKGNLMVSGSDDMTMRLWDTHKGKEIAQMICINESDWITILPDMYYSASKNAAKEISWVQDGNIFSFEQFDLKYNRPDIVMQRLEHPDTALIGYYHRAYLKRIKKLGMIEGMLDAELHVPEIAIDNAMDLPVVSTINEIQIHVSALDSKYPLSKLYVWVNDVPLYGIKGVDLSVSNQEKAELTLPIKLSSGNNKIEVSTRNIKGAESRKDAVHIQYQDESSARSTYYVGIGVSNYQDQQYNLTYAAKDVQDLSSALTSNYPDLIKYIYTDEQATRENILALKEELLNTSVDDQIILSLSGHGVLDDNLDFYYATYDIDFDDPAVNGLLYDDIEWLLDSIPARKKLVLMDACHSGEVDKELLAQLQTSDTSGSISIIPAGGKGARPLVGKPKLGMENSFALMQEMFADLSRGNGAVVISAAGGMEFAYEGEFWNNGVFTYSVLRGLQEGAADINDDDEITVSELKEFVSKEVETLTRGLQKPTSRQENLEFDFRVW